MKLYFRVTLSAYTFPVTSDQNQSQFLVGVGVVFPPLVPSSNGAIKSPCISAQFLSPFYSKSSVAHHNRGYTG